jgi:hypothetical protein
LPDARPRANSIAAGSADVASGAAGDPVLGLDLEGALRASLARLEGSKGTLGE